MRHGPAAPRPAGRPRVCGGCGGWWSTPGRWPVGRAVAPRPPPPFQVPSASRRGGLKTPGGGSPVRPPWGRGGRARGESGRCLPSPPDSAVPLRGPGWRVACRATVTAAAAVGRGLPGGRCVGRGRVRVRVRALRLPGGGWEPPGRLWGVRACLGGLAPDAPLCEAFPDPSGLLFPFCLTWPARGSFPPQLPPPTSGEGRGGGEDVPRQGRVSRRNKTLEKPRTTLSGGSLGSCVDEERS